MTEAPKAMYVTDDRDFPVDQQHALVIFPGGNGDWYVQVAPRHGQTTTGVRISTSGGAEMHCPGLGPAIADAYRAMIAAERGEVRKDVATRADLERELGAWRSAFPSHRFDGFFDVVESSD